MTSSLIQLSEELLLRMKKEQGAEGVITALAAYSFASLQEELPDDDHKKTFWINVYNAFYLYLRRERGVPRSRIFRDQRIRVAGHAFSLDDIEHGILRRYRWKWALGYLPDPFISSIVRQLAVRSLDYRIHFALNCGANSCPPIAFYDLDRIDAQLEQAQAAFLESDVVVKPEAHEVWVSRLFQWYIGDFGGKKGLRTLLARKEGFEPAYALCFLEYDRTENLDNYR